MQGAMEAERRMGYEPRDVSAKKCGYESHAPGTGKLRFIEVKGRRVSGKTTTVTKNEILTGLNKADDFLLAIVQVDNGEEATPRYVRRPFGREPDFGVTSVTYALTQFLRETERV